MLQQNWCFIAVFISPLHLGSSSQEGKGNSISGEDTEKEWHQRMPQDFELTRIKKVFSICLLTLEYYSVLGLSQRSYD